MPQLNGREVFRRMKAIQPNARLILMSRYTEQEIAKQFSKDGRNSAKAF